MTSKILQTANLREGEFGGAFNETNSTSPELQNNDSQYECPSFRKGQRLALQQ